MAKKTTTKSKEVQKPQIKETERLCKGPEEEIKKGLSKAKKRTLRLRRAEIAKLRLKQIHDGR